MRLRHHLQMELRHLRSFVVVAEELHVGRAADRLHLTQPSLSRQIGQLEKDVGVELFARVKRRFVLTPAGQLFLGRAQDIVRSADQAVLAVRRAALGELGTLRLSFVQSATFEALPRVLSVFRAAYPDVELELEPLTTLHQTSALRAGKIDVGLLRPPLSESGLLTKVVSRDPLVAALPAGHRLATADRLALADLADEPFVLYRRDSGPSVVDTIVGQCLTAGFASRVVQQAVDVQTIVSLVAAGLGVSLLIAPTPPIAEEAVVYRPLTDDLPPWELALAWSPDNTSPVLDRFLTTLAGP